MLDDRHGGRAGRVEFRDQFKGGVGVVDVIVGELLALQLARGRDAEAVLAGQIEARLLVRIFAIAHRLGQFSAHRAIFGRVDADRPRQPVGDRRVIGGGARIGLLRELLAQGEVGAAAIARPWRQE